MGDPYFETSLQPHQLSPSLALWCESAPRLGFGSSGFTNAALFAASLIANHDLELAKRLKEFRRENQEKVKRDDEASRLSFSPN